MSEIIIRPAVTQDSDAIEKIKNYYIENTDVVFTSEKAVSEVIAKDIYDNEDKYLVAERDGNVIGYACLLDFRVGGYYITKEVSLYVQQGLFGMGIGGSLLQGLIVLSKKRNLCNLVAFISSSNDKSMKLFEKNGFINSGELKNIAIKNEEYQTVSILQLEVSKL